MSSFEFWKRWKWNCRIENQPRQQRKISQASSLMRLLTCPRITSEKVQDRHGVTFTHRHTTRWLIVHVDLDIVQGMNPHLRLYEGTYYHSIKESRKFPYLWVGKNLCRPIAFRAPDGLMSQPSPQSVCKPPHQYLIVRSSMVSRCNPRQFTDSRSSWPREGTTARRIGDTLYIEWDIASRSRGD